MCDKALNLSFQPHVHTGPCDAAMPSPGQPGDCSRGLFGSWSPFFDSGCPASRAAQCMARCGQCPRCRYVSVHLTEDACAWFSSCPLAHPSPAAKNVPDAEAWQTIEVASTAGVRLPRSSCRSFISSWDSLSAGERKASSHCPRRPSAGATLVTSTSAGTLARAASSEYKGTIMQQWPPPAPLWFFVDRNSPAPPSARSPACWVVLEDAVDGLSEVVGSADSCIDAFYSVAGPREQFEDPLTMMSAKILLRKLAALWHTTLAVATGGLVVWADFDVVARHPLDGAFLRFARSVDVSTRLIAQASGCDRGDWGAARVRGGVNGRAVTPV